MNFPRESIFVQSVKRMTANLIVGKNVFVWVWGTVTLTKHPLLNSENVASISRWDNGREIKYVPGGANNPANFTNLVRNIYYLLEVKKPFQLSGAVLLLASGQTASSSLPTPTPAPTPAPAPTAPPPSSSAPAPAPKPTPSSPTPTPTPAPSTTGLPTKAELNTNLSSIADYSSQDPFLDKARSARAWWWRSEAPKGSFPTDENGYPLSIPASLGYIDTVIFADNPTVSAGRYVVMWDGVGEISWLSGTVVSVGQNQQVLDFGTGNVVLKLTSTGSSPGAGDYFKNLRIVREEQLALYQSGEIFNPLFLEKLKGYRRLRFMDWMATNFSQQKDWANRPKLSDYTYADKGVPVEIMVALCNKLKLHPWFCMPHMATDDYVEKFAFLVRDTLDPTLEIYLEFSNEVWNWQFSQATWCLNAGKALWGSDVGDANIQYTGMRAAQNTLTWKRVFGAAASRIFGVLATQTAYKGLEEGLLNAPKFVASGGMRPADVCKLYAITFYFSGNLITGENLNQVLAWRNDPDG